jgi:GNAT superfamily N-acetyltransferase
VSIRPAREGDTAGIQRVSLAAGQEQDGADNDYVRLLLDTGRVYVASEDEVVVGWAATKITSAGSMLTDLFVHPAYQARGIGRALLAPLWPAHQDGLARFTFSSQHASALPLYVRAGLSPYWPLLYMSGSATRLPAAPATCIRVDAQQAAQAEAHHTGLTRSADYAYWARGDRASGIVVHHGDRLVAVGIADATRLIHLCVVDETLAPLAVQAALRTLPSAASLCLPGPHPAVIQLLEHGFVVEEHDTYMSTRDSALPTTWVYSPGLA